MPIFSFFCNSIFCYVATFPARIRTILSGFIISYMLLANQNTVFVLNVYCGGGGVCLSKSSRGYGIAIMLQVRHNPVCVCVCVCVYVGCLRLAMCQSLRIVICWA